MITVRFTKKDLANKDGEVVGIGSMPHAPRAGEIIWLEHNRNPLRATRYRVTDIHYRVPNRLYILDECTSCWAYVVNADEDDRGGD